MPEPKTVVRAWLDERPLNPRRRQSLTLALANFFLNAGLGLLRSQRLADMERRITELENQVIALTVNAGVRDAVDEVFPPRRM